MSTPTEDELVALGEELGAAMAVLAEARSVLGGYRQVKQQYNDLIDTQQVVVTDARREVRRLAGLVADAALAQPEEPTP